MDKTVLRRSVSTDSRLSVTIQSLVLFNILVGPNNSGKSTILGAFGILTEMRERRGQEFRPLFQVQAIKREYRERVWSLPR
jgi:AAA15 family ATPase/GTPase